MITPLYVFLMDGLSWIGPNLFINHIKTTRFRIYISVSLSLCGQTREVSVILSLNPESFCGTEMDYSNFYSWMKLYRLVNVVSSGPIKREEDR